MYTVMYCGVDSVLVDSTVNSDVHCTRQKLYIYNVIGIVPIYATYLTFTYLTFSFSN